MKVHISFDLDIIDRRAIAAAFGLPDLADTETCLLMIRGAVAARIETLRDELDREHSADAYRAKCAGTDTVPDEEPVVAAAPPPPTRLGGLRPFGGR